MPDGGLGSRFPVAAQSPGLLLWRVTNRWQAAMRAALAPHELTHVQYVLLASLTWLSHREPERLVTQADLAGFAATDPMMTSQVVRTLERAGLVERLPHPTDGRARVLRPTAEGVAAARGATADVEAADAAFFAPVDAAAFASRLAALATPPQPD
ncbi:DNA-binding transcriptional regulator, MarR family [Leifsonia sp. 98AMF]|uniref:MarR family winged helix-turn-helix transcriptional regulator n=1 Tax=unclassified Leifsonia TaxID=2663824 RepID=UPI00087CD6C9|nr:MULTISPECIES: MarR family transcriptional regulator [unclassified Leifsonia]SDH48515.1 DNA-binding transcriptional regulator, MarR family [Leifsonia sp. 197AMF]SDI89200.1 DNA-binding transcriptional regulator, MarR family [Leifsonia sp. 466MF]SDJ91538.1 DNA-binding transcriptional regulator, MarR family [Leifsonia sp. 157MF]SDN92884.1 DNA-binding transcriptional regulator, MarR family [Leifsonia sp. 509MF]SEN12945.1 DNA-binding transcriptional regulator, MarR family [Leifsonia sp. 467MF]